MCAEIKDNTNRKKLYLCNHKNPRCTNPSCQWDFLKPSEKCQYTSDPHYSKTLEETGKMPTDFISEGDCLWERDSSA